MVGSFVERNNHVRLHSALGYLTPADKLAGLESVIFAERNRKLEAARELRRTVRSQPPTGTGSGDEASPGVQSGRQ